MHNRPRFALVGKLLALVGLGAQPPAVAAAVKSLTPTRLTRPLRAVHLPPVAYGPGLPRNNAKDWGMSRACGQMVRKNRLLRKGIAAAKI